MEDCFPVGIRSVHVITAVCANLPNPLLVVASAQVAEAADHEEAGLRIEEYTVARSSPEVKHWLSVDVEHGGFSGHEAVDGSEESAAGRPVDGVYRSLLGQPHHSALSLHQKAEC